MTSIGRIRLIWLMLCITCLYTASAWIWPNTQVLICLRSFQITTSIAVVIRWRAAFVQVWREGLKASDDVMSTVALVGAYASMGGSALWLYLWRGADEPRWMVDAAINGYFVLLAGWCALVHSTAPGTEAGRMSTVAKHYMIWVALSTVLLSVVGLYGGTEFKPVAEWLEPYLGERNVTTGLVNHWKLPKTESAP